MKKLQKYNIIICPGSTYKTFDDIAKVLCNVIKNKGAKCIISNSTREGYRPIILGAHRHNSGINFDELPTNTIIFNFEQLHEKSNVVSDYYINILKKYEVWDYSKLNIKWLKEKYDITNVKLIKIGYSKSLEYAVNDTNKDIDVLFIGSPNKRRSKVEKLLKEHSEVGKVVFEKDVWGDERDNLINRAKIVLNIHYHDTKLFEVIRVSNLLANKKCVISENSNDEFNYKYLKDSYISVPYENIVSTVVKYLSNDELIRKQSEKGYEIFRKHPQTLPLRIKKQCKIKPFIKNIKSNLREIFTINWVNKFDNNVIKIPIFIITHNRLTVLKKTLISFKKIKTPYEIVIHDNKSTYKPFVRFLKKLERSGQAKIIWHKQNNKKVHGGHKMALMPTIDKYYEDGCKSKYYIVTDPDITFDSSLPGDVLDFYIHLLEETGAPVVGPGLRIDDIPDEYPLKNKVMKWESRFWENPETIKWKGRDVKYSWANIDTTFGIYKKRPWMYHQKGIRVHDYYWARHLDWYINLDKLKKDQKNYVNNSPLGHWGSRWLRGEKTIIGS